MGVFLFAVVFDGSGWVSTAEERVGCMKTFTESLVESTAETLVELRAGSPGRRWSPSLPRSVAEEERVEFVRLVEERAEEIEAV